MLSLYDKHSSSSQPGTTITNDNGKFEVDNRWVICWTFRVIVASTNGGLASNEPKVNEKDMMMLMIKDLYVASNYLSTITYLVLGKN